MGIADFQWFDLIRESDWSAVERGWQHARFPRADFMKRCCEDGDAQLVDQFKRWASKHKGHRYALAWDSPGATNPIFVIARHTGEESSSYRSGRHAVA